MAQPQNNWTPGYYHAGVPSLTFYSGGYVAHAQVKTGAGIFFGFDGQYNGTANAWVMAFDAASAPSTGANPLAKTVAIGNNGPDSVFFVNPGRARVFTSGLYVALSSTGDTFTALNNNNMTFHVDYV